MVYAYDLWALLPVRDLFDTQMMLANINAHKDMYEKAAKEMEDFRKEYKDFLSPIVADMDEYKTNVLDKVKNRIDDLYRQGIDPLRSAEGRAAISEMINGMDYGRINFLKQRAENAKEWYKNQGILKAKNMYSQDLTDYLGEDPNKWAPDYIGSTSPTQYQTLQDFVDPSFAHLGSHVLTKDEVISRIGKDQYDPNKIYTGKSIEDGRNALMANVPGLKGSPLYGFYRELAKKDLINMGVEKPTDEQIDEMFVNNALRADWLRFTEMKEEYDPKYLARYKAALTRSNSGGGGNGNEWLPYYDLRTGLWRSAASNFEGVSISDYTPAIGKTLDDRQKSLISGIENNPDAMFNALSNPNGITEYLFAQYLRRPMQQDGSIKISDADKEQLISTRSWASNVKGSKVEKRKNIGLLDAMGVPVDDVFYNIEDRISADRALPTHRVGFAKDKDDRVRLVAEVNLLDEDGAICGKGLLPLPGLRSGVHQEGEELMLEYRDNFAWQTNSVKANHEITLQPYGDNVLLVPMGQDNKYPTIK